MTTTRRPTTAPRKAAAPRPLPEGFVARLHATTALSRMMRGDHAGAAEALGVLSAADRADIARAAADLSEVARGAQDEGAA